MDDLDLNDREIGEEEFEAINSCEALAIVDGVTIPTFKQLEAEANAEDAVQSRDAKEYLGDSVYIYDEDGFIRMTTDNGHGANNEIFLDDSVLNNLVKFLAKRGYVK